MVCLLPNTLCTWACFGQFWLRCYYSSLSPFQYPGHWWHSKLLHCAFFDLNDCFPFQGLLTANYCCWWGLPPSVLYLVCSNADLNHQHGWWLFWLSLRIGKFFHQVTLSLDGPETVKVTVSWTNDCVACYLWGYNKVGLERLRQIGFNMIFIV